MRSIFANLRRAIALPLALLTFGLAASGCVGDAEPSSGAVSDYEVKVAADGRDVVLNVQVSEATADTYRSLEGHNLDVNEIQSVIGERIRRAVDEGAVELSADANAQIDVVFDLDQKPGDPSSFQAADACVVSWGTATYSYTLFVRDAYGCRSYRMVDYYDIQHNNCNNQNTLQYLFTTSDGPYWGC